MGTLSHLINIHRKKVRLEFAGVVTCATDAMNDSRQKYMFFLKWCLFRYLSNNKIGILQNHEVSNLIS